MRLYEKLHVSNVTTSAQNISIFIVRLLANFSSPAAETIEDVALDFASLRAYLSTLAFIIIGGNEV